MVYHGCLPSMLLKHIHDGFPRVVGPGSLTMKDACGITVDGVYCTDRLETACKDSLVSASAGPAGICGYSGSALMVEDCTIPFKVVLRCLADPTGLLWRKADLRNWTFCFLPATLFTNPTSCVWDSIRIPLAGVQRQPPWSTSRTK